MGGCWFSMRLWSRAVRRTRGSSEDSCRARDRVRLNDFTVTVDFSQDQTALFADPAKAVFGGHYHTYGPTREFDGIRYFITGGGGAGLRPEYKQSGGVHHFLRIKVSGEGFDVRVVTEQGELTDPEADLMAGLQFAARNVSRIAPKPDAQDLRGGLP